MADIGGWFEPALLIIVQVVLSGSFLSQHEYLKESDPTTRGRALPTDSPQQKEAPFPTFPEGTGSRLLSQTSNTTMSVFVVFHNCSEWNAEMSLNSDIYS